MPSFQDSAFLVLIALLLFGPKGLAKLARELGKLMGEFRRASSEFRLQMDEEFRLVEQEEKQKKIAAIEAAAPIQPAFPIDASETGQVESAVLPEPEHPHAQPEFYGVAAPEDAQEKPADILEEPAKGYIGVDGAFHPFEDDPFPQQPIASNGDLHLMPPETGVPVSRSPSSSSLSGVFDSIPQAAPEPTEAVHNG
jgi:sec-independent protein translocase protein TatB